MSFQTVLANIHRLGLKPLAKEASTDLYLICDEAGAKGRATAQERGGESVGIFAGYICPGELLLPLRRSMSAVCVPYRNSDGKLHITDLAPQAMQELRDAVFGILLEVGLPCIYEAIHVAGFSAHYQANRKTHDILKAARRSMVSVNFREEAPCLHYELLVGLFAKALPGSKQSRAGILLAAS